MCICTCTLNSKDLYVTGFYSIHISYKNCSMDKAMMGRLVHEIFIKAEDIWLSKWSLVTNLAIENVKSSL